LGSKAEKLDPEGEGATVVQTITKYCMRNIPEKLYLQF